MSTETPDPLQAGPCPPARQLAQKAVCNAVRKPWRHGWLCTLMFVQSLVTTPAAAAALEPELEALQAFEQASVEIKARRFDRAEILLERVLMLQPENAEALVELALLMAARGHEQGAQALVQSLIDDTRTEPSHVQALKSLHTLIQQGAADQGRNPYALNAPTRKPQSSSVQSGQAAAAQWRGEAHIGLSSNPLARTSADAITITLPDGPLSLPLAQAKHAGTMQGVNLSHSTNASGAELAVQGASVNGASTAARALAWGRLPQAPWWGETQPILLAYAQAHRGLDGQHRAQAGLAAISGQQKYSLTRYHEYNATDQGLIARIEHHQPRWLGIDWSASLERSVSNTGPQGYWRAVVAGEQPMGEQGKLLFQWSRQNDTYGYSSLLKNGARRHLEVLHVAYEQRHTLDHEKSLVWRVFTGERQSNLSLFEYKEIGL